MAKETITGDSPERNRVDVQRYFLASIVDSSEDSIITIDFEGVITSWNKAAEWLYGYSAAEAIGQPLTMLTLPKDLQEILGNIEKIRTGGHVVTFDTVRVHKDGQALQLEIVLSPVKDEAGAIVGVSTIARDITSRRKVEEAVLFQAHLLDTVQQAVIATDLEGYINYWNRFAEELYGWTAEEALGRNVAELITPEISRERAEEIMQVLRERNNWSGEFTVQRKDGHLFQVQVSNSPITDKEGKLVGMIGVSYDISEQKEMDMRLRKSEEHLRVTMESIKDYAIFTMDLDRKVNKWNAGAAAIFGYTEEEMLGQSGDIIFTPEDIAAGAPEEEANTALTTGCAIDERWHIRKDGSRFYASGVMNQLRNGELHGLVKVCRDLTEQRLAAERLQASEERYQKFISQSSEGIWRFEMEKAIDISIPHEQQIELIYQGSYLAECNDAMAHMYGYAGAAEMQNARLSDLLPYNQESIGYLKHFIESGYRVSDAESHEIDKEGLEKYFINNLVGIVEDGLLSRAWGTQRDITERKALEKLKEVFIGVASHELRTPVASIKAFAELLEDVLTESGDTQSISLVRKLNGQVDRLAALVRDLLDVTKITEGKMQLREDLFNISSLVDETVEELQRTTTHKLEAHMQMVPNIVADKERIRQVLVNLISNAVKYSPNADKVLITSRLDKDYVTICVRDYGIGMSEKEQRMAFERFYRSEDASMSTFPGLGLGLYIASEIVQKHKGKMHLVSAPGRGSTFCFSLPLR